MMKKKRLNKPNIARKFFNIEQNKNENYKKKIVVNVIITRIIIIR